MGSNAGGRKELPRGRSSDHSGKDRTRENSEQDSEIHQEPPDEHEGKKRKNVPGSKQSPQSVKKQKDAVDSHTPSNEHEGTIGENALSQKELDQDNTKPGETDVGYCQSAAYVLTSPTPAAQSLYEANSFSYNTEVKLQHVVPPIQGVHATTQSYHLSLMPQHTVHCVQQSSSQESPLCSRAKLSNILPENTLSLNSSTFPEDSSEMKQAVAISVIDYEAEPFLGIPTKNEENEICLVKAVNDVNKFYESLHGTSEDTIQKRSMENLSCPKPSVDPRIEQNSDGQSTDDVNCTRTSPVLLHIVCDSTATQNEYAFQGGQTKTTVYDTLIESLAENGCTVEQLPDVFTSNFDTLENKDENEFAVIQTECEEHIKIITDIKEVGKTTGIEKLPSGNSFIVKNSLVSHVDEYCVESLPKPSDSISTAGDENERWPFDSEINKEVMYDEMCNWKTAVLGDMVTIDETVRAKQSDWKDVAYDETSDWKHAEYGDIKMTIDDIVDDEQNDWKDAAYDEINDWKNAEWGDMKTIINEIVDDKQNDWTETLIEDTKMADFLETDETNNQMFEDKENKFEEASDDAMDLARTEMPNRCNSSCIDCVGEHRLNEVNGTQGSRTERQLEHYSPSSLVLTRNEEHVNKYLEEFIRSEHPKGQPGSSFETSEENGISTDKSDVRFIGRFTLNNKQDLSTAETDSPYRVGDKQDGAFFEGLPSQVEEKDIANVQQNTRRLKARHPVGLQNLGNTCFFNAVMQNMNQSLLLVEHLAEKDFPRHSLTKSMVDFYDLMMLSKHRSTVSPSDVLNNICQRSPRFAGGRQQDSHELLRHLLDGLRHEERKSKGDPNNRKTLTKVDEVFGGHFMTVYTCKDCKTPYHVCEPMLDMSLPIAYEDFENDEGSSLNEEDNETVGDNQKYRKAAKSLMTPLAIEQKQDAEDHHNAHVPKAEEKKQSKKEAKNGKRKSHSQRSASKQRRREGRSILDCLDAFTRTELIADEYLCMHCHETRVNEGATDYQMTSAKKRTLIYNPPALLTLHLKRFEQTPYGFVKCNDTISFHDMIDIGPYCSSWCMRNEENETSIWYSLYGLVCHSGSLDGGHYVAYVKMRETEDIRQFLQKKFLNRDELTVEELVKMMTKMQRSREPNQPEKWQPKPVKGTWYYITDSHVSKVPEEQVWRQQAYLLFYERRQGNHGNEKLICYQRNAGNEDTSF